MDKQLFELSNARLRIRLTNYGARLVTVETLTSDGSWVSVCAGFDDLDTYERSEVQYFGATVGRVAGRLARGKFDLGSKVLQLETNEGGNHLHGGIHGAIHNKIWDAKDIAPDSIVFELESPDGAGGFPGNVLLSVEYRLVGNVLQITQRGETDTPTPLNLTNHAYWNLSGSNASASEHELQISSDKVIPFDKALLPTGPAKSVAGTELDFLSPRQIGVLDELLTEPLPGYDHTYLLGPTTEVRRVAKLYSPDSGISMIVSTDSEALQFYAGNRNPVLDASNGIKLRQGNTVCLEAFGVNNPEIVGDYSSILITAEHPLHRVVSYEFEGWDFSPKIAERRSFIGALGTRFSSNSPLTSCMVSVSWV